MLAKCHIRRNMPHGRSRPTLHSRTKNRHMNLKSTSNRRLAGLSLKNGFDAVTERRGAARARRAARLLVPQRHSVPVKSPAMASNDYGIVAISKASSEVIDTAFMGTVGELQFSNQFQGELLREQRQSLRLDSR